MLPPDQIARLKSLMNRLRGRYAIGPIMPNGEPEFGYRQFDQTPDGKPFPAIHGEAADEIEAVLKLGRWDGWRPIETAPKDGTPVLLSRGGDFLFGCWSGHGPDDPAGCWDADVEYGGQEIDPAPDHWQPIPPPPQEQEEGSSQSQPVLSPKSDMETYGYNGERPEHDTEWKRGDVEKPVHDGWGERYLLTWCTRTATYDIGCIDGNWSVGETVETSPGELWRWLDVNPERHLPPERDAADGASSRHTGQLRDEPSSSNLNEESQTNGR